MSNIGNKDIISVKLVITYMAIDSSVTLTDSTSDEECFNIEIEGDDEEGKTRGIAYFNNTSQLKDIINHFNTQFKKITK